MFPDLWIARLRECGEPGAGIPEREHAAATVDKSEELKRSAIACSDRKWHWTEARLAGCSVICMPMSRHRWRCATPIRAIHPVRTSGTSAACLHHRSARATAESFNNLRFRSSGGKSITRHPFNARLSVVQGRGRWGGRRTRGTNCQDTTFNRQDLRSTHGLRDDILLAGESGDMTL